MREVYYEKRNDALVGKPVKCDDCAKVDRCWVGSRNKYLAACDDFVSKHIAEGYLATREKWMSKAVYIPYDQLVHKSIPVITPDTIQNVIFNDPATIVFWQDGTKTVVKCQEGDEFDPEKGLTMAIAKKMFGNKGNYCNVIKKWTEPWYEKENLAIQNSLEDFLNFMRVAGKKGEN